MHRSTQEDYNKLYFYEFSTNLHEFWKFKQFFGIKSDNQICKMERTAHRWVEIRPTAVALVNRRPARLGLATAQMAGTGPCQPGARGGGNTW
jgi:hypothetical protein